MRIKLLQLVEVW